MIPTWGSFIFGDQVGIVENHYILRDSQQLRLISEGVAFVQRIII